MKINQIDNINFSARIKLQKPEKIKLIEDTAIIGAGASSMFTGLDSFNVVPSTVAETMIDSSLSTSGESSADALIYMYSASLPLGMAYSTIGTSELLKDGYLAQKNNKDLPS